MIPATLKAFMEGDLGNAIIATTPGGIEAQEARGQKDFVASEVLPKKMCHGCTREKLEKMGIVFGEDVDDLFVKCQLPSGWKKEPTEHSMWSKLIDEKGRERAMIFYKAAFYDERAHISLSKRFSPHKMPEDRYKTDCKDRQAGNWYGIVLDGEKEIYITDPIKAPSFKQTEELYEEASAWLDERYPDWKNELAYWD